MADRPTPIADALDVKFDVVEARRQVLAARTKALATVADTQINTDLAAVADALKLVENRLTGLVAVWQHDPTIPDWRTR